MKRVLSVSLLTLCVLIPAAYADEKEAGAKAQRAATAWLALTDGGKYAESWDSSAALFKAAITKPDWEKALKSARSPLGALKSRKLKSATFARSLPGAPAGEYVSSNSTLSSRTTLRRLKPLENGSLSEIPTQYR